MGQALGGVFGDAEQERMHKIISEVLGEFSKQFPLKYKDALIHHIKKESQGYPDNHYQLSECPIPDYELKTGSLVKRGDLRKNWKKRWFVALNRADNFRIDYFEAEGSQKKKGIINCFGYRYEDFDEEDRNNFGQFGIKLVPYDERRRTWYMRAENEEDRKDWEQIFRNACRKAKPPVDPDPLIAKAFKGAYQATRWHYGYWGYWCLNNTESEMLGGLIGEILSRELLRDVYRKVPAGPARGKVLGIIRKTVDGAVITAVNAAWKGATSSCSAMKGSLESAASELLTPLFEAEENLKTQISDRVNETARPVLEEVGGKICQPVFSALLSPITAAYTAAIRGLYAHMQERVERIATDPNTLGDECHRAHREVDYWYSGPMAESNRVLWKMYISDLAAIADCFSTGFSAYDVYATGRDNISWVLHNAIYTFKTMVEEENGDPVSILHLIIPKLVNDCKICEEKSINNILYQLIAPTIDERIINPASDLVAPINDLIPDPVKDLVDLGTMTEEVIEDIVNNAIEAITSTGMGGEHAKIEAAGNELLA